MDPKAAEDNAAYSGGDLFVRTGRSGPRGTRHMLHRHWADGHDRAAVRAAYVDARVLRSASGAWFVLSCHRILPGVGLKMSPNQVSGRTAFIVKEFRARPFFKRGVC